MAGKPHKYKTPEERRAAHLERVRRNYSVEGNKARKQMHRDRAERYKQKEETHDTREPVRDPFEPR